MSRETLQNYMKFRFRTAMTCLTVDIGMFPPPEIRRKEEWILTKLTFLVKS